MTQPEVPPPGVDPYAPTGYGPVTGAPAFAPGTQAAGFPAPGFPAPGFPGPGFPPPAPPARRPGPVIAAAVVLIVFGALGTLGNLARNASAADSAVAGGAAYATGILIGTLFLYAVTLGAIGTGIWLLVSPAGTGAARVCATIAAAGLLITVVGVVATVAVPILLFAPKSAQAWFRADSPPTVPAPY